MKNIFIKTSLFLILTMSLILGCKNSEIKTVKNDLELNGLKGNVKAIYDLESGDLLEEYDKDGYLIYDTEAVGVALCKNKYKRDINHYVTEKISQPYNDDSPSATSKISFKNQYDNDNFIIESESNFKEKIKYKYDEKKRLIEKTTWSSLNGKYEISEIIIYVYDDKDNLIFKRTTDSKNFVFIDSYLYDSNNIRISANFNLYSLSNKDSDGTHNYKYDKNGNIISEEVNKGFNSENYKYEYEYDTHGNWVKKKTFFAPENVQIQKRRIVYYSEVE